MDEKSADPAEKTGKKGMENLMDCPKCQFVYDIRYLSETCRFEEDAGYRCMNCNTVLG
jgi:transposase-like protein